MTYIDPYAAYVTGNAAPNTPPITSGSAPSVDDRIVGAESSGNPTATNPNSSAAGAGQFINSTWLNMVNKYRPDLAVGKTPQQVLALRSDANLSKAMTNVYAADNSESLSNAGLQSTPGNIYLAHFAGPQGAIDVLKANPNTPVSQVLGQKAVQANPFLQNMTVGQLQQWAANKVGASASATPEGYYGGQQHVTVTKGQDPYAAFVNSPNAASIGTGSAMMEGALTGAGAGWRDEIYGASQASGLPDYLGGFRAPIGAARLAYEHLTGQPGEATQAYNAAVDKIRAYQAQAQEQHPLAFGTGELGGAVGTLAAVPMGDAATIGARAIQAAKVGGAYGAISGAGEGTDADSRLAGAATGGIVGAAGGAAAVPVMAGAEAAGRAAYNYAVKPGVSLARGLINSANEGSRRVVGAIQRDVQSGRAGLTPQEWLLAHNAGEPVAIADLGGANTQNLMRSASNTSPEAEAAIRGTIEDRYATQNQRVADTVRSLVANGANATKSRAQLEAEYDIAREPLYAKAYREGAKGVWNDEIKRLSGTPSIQDAIRGAVPPMKDRGIIAGYKLPRSNPFVPNPAKNGAMELRVDTKGNSPIPELAFWDQIVRNLNGRIGELMRSGNETRARDIIQLKNSLVTQLDDAVPSYAKARGVAAEFFKANNAIEAGEKAVSFKGDPVQVRVQMNKMGNAERELFKEGFASKLAQQIEATGDRTNVINKVYSSPQSRKLIQTVFGDDGATKIEMRLRLENIMQNGKVALGNSTTARQLIQSGLAGGAIGAYLEGHDLGSALHGFGEGVSIGAGIRLGGNKLVGVIDQRTAQKVGEFLASNDLTQLAKGIRMASSNNRVANAIRMLDNRLAALASAKGASGIRSIQGTMPSAAQDNQNQ